MLNATELPEVSSKGGLGLDRTDLAAVDLYLLPDRISKACPAYRDRNHATTYALKGTDSDALFN